MHTEELIRRLQRDVVDGYDDAPPPRDPGCVPGHRADAAGLPEGKPAYEDELQAECGWRATDG